MKRNRIVINLDSPAPRKTSGRLVKPLVIIAVVLFLIVAGVGAGGYFGWRHFQSGPTYSLAILVDAVQRHDTITVDKMFDTDKISADFVTQVRDKTAGSTVWSSQADVASATISARLKETVHEQLINEIRELTQAANGKPLVIIALSVPWYADIKQESNTALATVNIKGEVIKLTMQRSEENRWRIVAVQDDKLAKLVADAVVKNLPSNASHLQDEIRKQLDKLTR